MIWKRSSILLRKKLIMIIDNTHYFTKDRTHKCDFSSFLLFLRKFRILLSMAFACISHKRVELFFMKSRVRFLRSLAENMRNHHAGRHKQTPNFLSGKKTFFLAKEDGCDMIEEMWTA